MTELIESQAQQIRRALAATTNPPPAPWLVPGAVHLVKVDMTIDANTTLAALVAAEADYSGYATQPFVWPATAEVNDQGIVEMVAVQLLFQPTSSVVTNTIWGIFISDAGTGNLLYAARFEDGPYPMGGVLDAIRLNVLHRPAVSSVVNVVS